MMRNLLLSFTALLGACQGRHAGADITFDGVQAMQDVRHQTDAGPRVPNTPAHVATGDWILSRLRGKADSVEVQAFSHVTLHHDTLRLRNFLARFKPAATDRVLFITHWDSRPHADNDPLPANHDKPIPGADDGASGTAVLLGVADKLKLVPPSVGVDLLFVDGEDYGSFEDNPPDDVLIGATYFAQHLPAGYHPLYGVLLDMVGDSDQVFPKEQYSRDNAPEVVDRVYRTAQDMGMAKEWPDHDTGYITDDHVPLIRAGLRVIDLIDIDYPYWHTTADTADKLSAQSLVNIGRLVLALVK